MSVIPHLIEQIEQRLAELESPWAEYEKLRRVRAEMLGETAPEAEVAPGATAASAPPSPSLSASASASAQRGASARVRPPAPQEPADDAAAALLDLIRRRPGVTAESAIAELGVDNGTVFRGVGQLMRRQLVRKEGDGYHVL